MGRSGDAVFLRKQAAGTVKENGTMLSCLQTVQIACAVMMIGTLLYAVLSRRYVYLGLIPMLAMSYIGGGARYAVSIDAIQQTSAESPAAAFAVHALAGCRRPPPFQSVPMDQCVANIVQRAKAQNGSEYANQAAQGIGRYFQRASKNIPLSLM